MRRGSGECGAHHGELLQGWFDDGAGAVRPGLVTLPLPGHSVRAVFDPDPACPLAVSPPDRHKALRAARLTLDAIAGREPDPSGTLSAGVDDGTSGDERTGCRRTGAGLGSPSGPPDSDTVRTGRLMLRGGVPAGLGMGSSTADVVAAIRAVADACGVRPSSRTIARLAVAAEAASDPLMFDDRPRLFAHRDGDVLEELGPSLPPVRVLGCVLDGGRPVDTPSARPPAPSADDVAFHADLRACLRRAVAAGDVTLLADVATASALRARPGVAPLAELAADLGAAGIQIAHSGNVAGLLFDAARVPRGAPARLRAHGVAPVREFTAGGHRWTSTWPTPSDDRISSVSTRV